MYFQILHWLWLSLFLYFFTCFTFWKRILLAFLSFLRCKCFWNNLLSGFSFFLFYFSIIVIIPFLFVWNWFLWFTQYMFIMFYFIIIAAFVNIWCIIIEFVLSRWYLDKVIYLLSYLMWTIWWFFLHI